MEAILVPTSKETTMLTPESRRQYFPSLERMTYLNTAAEGIPPLAVYEALTQYFRDKQLGMDGRERHFAQWEAAKAFAAQCYGLTPAEVGICACSAEAHNLVALALRLQPGGSPSCP
jgi:selenocysteine lyase/cysteine desulfurase